jgi:hypothetical protein
MGAACLSGSQTTWNVRQTLGKGASDNLPDLPGSPRRWLMDDPPFSPPPSPNAAISKANSRVEVHRQGRAWLGWAGRASVGLLPPPPPSYPACNPMASLLLPQMPPFIALCVECPLTVGQAHDRSLSPGSVHKINNKQDRTQLLLMGSSDFYGSQP